MEGKDGKTEFATARRREEEREKGTVCMSEEIVTLVVLLCGVFTLKITAQSMFAGFNMLMTKAFAFNITAWTGQTVKESFFDGMAITGHIAGPLMIAIMIASIAASMAQTGPFFSVETLTWKFTALNPVGGFKRLLSVDSILEMALSMLKLSIIALVVYKLMKKNIMEIVCLSSMSLPSATAWMFNLVLKLIFSIMVVFVIVAIIDWCHKKYKFEKNLMMSIQEVKDEGKEQQTSPMVKRAQVKKAREFTLMRMMAEVPKATVVITNPTHVAVALEYKPDTMEAPRIVAKGLRLVAERIKRIARENNVPIIEQPALARDLYKNAKLGREIPTRLFEAVAEVLAYLYKIGRGVAPAA